MLLSASQHMPPVSAPSPTTATTCRLRWPLSSNALAKPVGVGQRGAGVAGLDPVVLALAARRIARQPALLAQVVEVGAASRQHLVDVGLVAGVEDDRIVRRVEHPVQGERQLDDAQVGAEMSAGGSNLVDQEFTDLDREIVHLRLRQVLQISGTADLRKHRVSLRTGTWMRPVKARRRRARRRGPRRRSRARECGDTRHCG